MPGEPGEILTPSRPTHRAHVTNPILKDCSSSRSEDAHELEEGIHRVASQRGAPQWLRDNVQERRMALGKLREGLGAPGVCSGPLSGLCPGGLRGLVSGSRGGVFRRCSFPTWSFFAGQLERSHGTGRREASKDQGVLCRLGTSMWWPARLARRQGSSLQGSPLVLAAKFVKRTAPWASTGRGTFRAIASLGLLGAQVGIMVLLSEQWFDWGIESAGRVTFGSNA